MEGGGGDQAGLKTGLWRYYYKRVMGGLKSEFSFLDYPIGVGSGR